MREIKREVKQSKHQREFCDLGKTHRITAFFGGLQGGKSIAGADLLYEDLYIHQLALPEQIREALSPEVWILSKSYALADMAWSYFKWRAGEDVVYTPEECRKLHLDRGDSRTHWLKPMGRPDGKPIRLRIRTAHDPEQLRAVGTLLIAWCDEIAFWPEVAWLNLQGRGIVTPTVYIITTTPKGKNWLYRDVYLPGKDGTDKNTAVVTCRSVDNPWADQDYLVKLRAKFGPEYAAQELDALFTAAVGYVYDFDRSMHLAEPPSTSTDDYKARVIGLDPGYGDPYAAYVCLKDWDNNWWIADEMYLVSKAIVNDAVPWLRHQCNKWKIQHIYVDKRRPSDWEALRRMQLPALPNVEVFGENDRRTIMPGVRMIQRLFRENRIRVAPHCEWIQEEFENYAFPDREAKNAGENPVDFKNHGMDSVRYAIVSVDCLPEDRRVRVRGGADMMPRGVGIMPVRGGNRFKMPTVKESLAAQEKKMDHADKVGRRLQKARRLGRGR